jgi:hypothetical protein
VAIQIYLYYPQDRHVPGMQSWVEEAVAAIATRQDWSGWTIRQMPLDRGCSANARDLYALVVADLGPVLLLQPVQERFHLDVQGRLHGRSSVLRREAYSSAEVVQHLEEARSIHDSGEPHLPRRFVVALLMMRKLERNLMWAGRNKGYMWVDDIRKGRGLDEQFSDQVPEVLSLLYQHGILIAKPSQGGTKYALNPDRREEIHEILTRRRFLPPLSVLLLRDVRLASARELDLLDCYDAGPPRAPLA